MPLRLILVRHGLSSFNLEHRVQGRNDLSSLTEQGIEQASKAGDALKEISINSVYSSPLQRAANTTNQILSKFDNPIEPIFDNDLLEVDLGQWSGLTIEEIKTSFPEEYKLWKKEPHRLRLKRNNGIEFFPIKDLMAQAKRFLEKLVLKHPTNRNQTILVIGHNAILRCIILQMLENPSKGFRRIKLDNASISIINIQSAIDKSYKLQIESLNNTSHLDLAFTPKVNKPRILLVRHGETNWNKEGRFQGQIDIPLNENGKLQAEKAAKFLKHIPIDKAFSSSMSRPTETARIILENHKVIEIRKEEDFI